MAVKVMVAPTISQGAAKLEPAKRARAPGEPSRPKRRRSSVYDADGQEVFITLMCLKCHKMRPLSQFGLRRMADGAIRNQPWCRVCRSAAGTGKGRDRGAAESVESSLAEGSLAVAVEPAPVAPDPVAPPPATGALAAQVAAALAGGPRR
jgi:hypothetical protein